MGSVLLLTVPVIGAGLVLIRRGDIIVKVRGQCGSDLLRKARDVPHVVGSGEKVSWVASVSRQHLREFLCFGVPRSPMLWQLWGFLGLGVLIFFVSPVFWLLCGLLCPVCCGSWPVVEQKRLRQGHECGRECVYERCKPPRSAE